MIYVVFLLVYSFLVTLFIIISYVKRDKRLDLIIEGVRVEVSSERPFAERVEMLGKVYDLDGKRTLWYEKSVSVVGVVAFISMTMAAAFQTISANSIKAEFDLKKYQYEQVLKNKDFVDSYVESVSEAIMKGAFDRHRIGDLEKKILRYRLDSIRDSLYGDKNKVAEAFSLAMTLKEYEVATDLLEDSKEMLDINSLSDRITLAEYYYLVGVLQASREMLNKVSVNSLKERSLLKRYFVLKVSLGSGIDKEKDNFARLARIRVTSAEDMLSNGVKKLEEAVKRPEY